MTGPFFPSARVATVAAAVLTVAAALAWHDAYERRGRRRPTLLRFLPGVV